MKNNTWLIGAGIMAQDYIKVLNDLDTEVTVIGRSETSAAKFQKETGVNVILGGIDNYINSKPQIPTHAIVSVGVEKLFETTKSLLSYGIKNILVEKPGFLNIKEANDLEFIIKENNANVLIAYNRRFYASVLKGNEIIENDGGVTSFSFEFTEWAHIIEKIEKAPGVKEKWFLANSTHVVDLAFHLGGKPKKISSYTSGSLTWHPSSSNFSGSGISDKDTLFNYQANWESAGRWSVEILTKKNRLIFKPMEKLLIQKKGTIPQIEDESIDYTLDEKYKPGLYLQTKNFLENNFNRMCTLKEQSEIYPTYNQIAGYK